MVFLPLVVALYYCTPARWRWLPLLAASVYFYMYFIPVFMLVMAAVILVDYGAARMMGAQPQRKRFWLVASLTANIGVLFTFKYLTASLAGWNEMMNALDWNYSLPALKIILPIGLSFHTFQAMSYTIEVYFGRQAPEKHLGYYALYVMFFPQLVAGPIERPQNLLPQLHHPPLFNDEKFVSGLRLILWGLFKKTVMADRLSEFVDGTYGSYLVQPAQNLILATIFFSFQIYYDFSAYSDIARGSARLFGFDLMVNFRMPYFSTSFSEFWNRWHISLSTWFRDYVYIPLGGSRTSESKTIRNLGLVFLISGIWHGAGVTFLIWGLLHLFYLLWERRFVKPVIGGGLWFRRVRTFFLVTVAWIFFRADSLAQAIAIVQECFFLNHFDFFIWRTLPGLMTSVFLITVVTIGEYFWEEKKIGEWFFSAPRAVRWSAYYGILITIAFMGQAVDAPFIYFQF